MPVTSNISTTSVRNLNNAYGILYRLVSCDPPPPDGLKSRAPCGAHVLVAVAYSRVGMADEAVVQVHVPVVPQLLLPREILQRVHLVVRPTQRFCFSEIGYVLMQL